MCCVWVLAALLAAASVDAIPDPPALDPHFAATKAPGLNECPTIVPDQSGSQGSHILAQLRTLDTIFVGDTQPDNAATLIARTGQAADSSPPASASRFL